MPRTPSPPATALVFPGQGAQHPRMAAGLYGHDATFTACMDEAFTLLGEAGPRLRDAWLAADPPEAYDDVTVAQPLLYAVNHALGRMVMDWGAVPVALLGHSVGELAAATLAGVLSFADGIALMRDRLDRFAATPPGGMLAVAASVNDVADLLATGRVHLAAVNAARQLLLAGESAPLAEAARILADRGVICRPAAARQAFHSPVVAGAVEETRAGFRAVAWREPRLTLYSAYTGGVLTARDARDPDFWAWQAARTVRFAPTLARLLDDHDCLLLEAGPGDGLSRLARRQPRIAAGRSAVRSLLPSRSRGDAADRSSAAEARAWLTGERHALSVGGGGRG
ncbi:hypothetical protein GCM10022221_73150 [Actinocorallia aurea]